jgi:hypothetical protein
VLSALNPVVDCVVDCLTRQRMNMARLSRIGIKRGTSPCNRTKPQRMVVPQAGGKPASSSDEVRGLIHKRRALVSLPTWNPPSAAACQRPFDLNQYLVDASTLHHTARQIQPRKSDANADTLTTPRTVRADHSNRDVCQACFIGL